MPKGESDFPGGEGNLVAFSPREKGAKLSFPKEKGVRLLPKEKPGTKLPFPKEDGVGFSWN